MRHLDSEGEEQSGRALGGRSHMFHVKRHSSTALHVPATAINRNARMQRLLLDCELAAICEDRSALLAVPCGTSVEIALFRDQTSARSLSKLHSPDGTAS